MGSVVDLCVVSVMKMTFTEIARLAILIWVMKLKPRSGTGQVVAIDVIAGIIKVVLKRRAP